MSIVSTTAEDMKNRIYWACAEVTPEMLAYIREYFRQRILKCILVEDHHFKHRE